MKRLKSDSKSPRFDENRPESLLDLVKDETGISEGVKFVAKKGNENIVKERKRKALSGMKKLRLKDIKGMPE